MTPGIVIAAPCWARNTDEADRLYEAIRSLSEHQMPVILADGGSDVDFIERVTELPDVSLLRYERQEGGRLLSQVKRALKTAGALAPSYVLYTEPDKRWFFESRLDDFLRRAAAAPGVGIVVAARDDASFATFPRFQQVTETLLNQLCAETWGQRGDFLYGPLLIHASLLPHLGQIGEDIGWGWRIFMLAVCHRLGLPIAAFPADLPCPLEQRDEDDPESRIYRMEQLAQNVKGLALGMKHPLEGGARTGKRARGRSHGAKSR